MTQSLKRLALSTRGGVAIGVSLNSSGLPQASGAGLLQSGSGGDQALRLASAGACRLMARTLATQSLQTTPAAAATQRRPPLLGLGWQLLLDAQLVSSGRSGAV